MQEVPLESGRQKVGIQPPEGTLCVADAHSALAQWVTFEFGGLFHTGYPHLLPFLPSLLVP